MPLGVHAVKLRIGQWPGMRYGHVGSYLFSSHTLNAAYSAVCVVLQLKERKKRGKEKKKEKRKREKAAHLLGLANVGQVALDLLHHRRAVLGGEGSPVEVSLLDKGILMEGGEGIAASECGYERVRV